MQPEIQEGAPHVYVSIEDERMCGFRKPSANGVGIYLMSSGESFEPCERLPHPLVICPCCGQGIKFSRAFTWIDPMQMFAPDSFPVCSHKGKHQHENCPMCSPSLIGHKAGLLWVGEKFYPDPSDFTREAMDMGVSRKIPSLPHGFEVGKDVVFCAHKKAINAATYPEWFAAQAKDATDIEFMSGVFFVFRPERVDLVIEDENDIPEIALNIYKNLKGNARIVKVVHNTPEQGVLDVDASEE